VSARVVADMPEAEYHAHPAFSHSQAKLLRQTCPRKFRDGVRQEKRVFDVGRAAHARILGVGAELVRVDREEWNTKAVKAEVAAIRAAGMTPLRPSDWDTVHAMAAALRADPDVSDLIDLQAGAAEQSMFWSTTVTVVTNGEVVDVEVPRRARLDYQTEGGTVRIIDYKTVTSAHPDALRRSVEFLGYDSQQDWYVDAAWACLSDVEAVGFAFLAQEKDPPYICHPFYLDPGMAEDGRRLNDYALRVYAACLATDEWPAYGVPGQWTRIARSPWRDRDIDAITQETA
jgi:hypothetical protein